MTPLFVLVLTICSSSSTDCTDVIKDIFTTNAKCEQEIYEERYFNANCYPADKFVLDGKLTTVKK